MFKTADQVIRIKDCEGQGRSLICNESNRNFSSCGFKNLKDVLPSYRYFSRYLRHVCHVQCVQVHTHPGTRNLHVYPDSKTFYLFTCTGKKTSVPVYRVHI